MHGKICRTLRARLRIHAPFLLVKFQRFLRPLLAVVVNLIATVVLRVWLALAILVRENGPEVDTIPGSDIFGSDGSVAIT